MKRRLTLAFRASAAMLSVWPALVAAFIAARTLLVLVWDSRRRCSASRLVWSAMGGIEMGGALDGREEDWGALSGQTCQFGGVGGGQRGPVGADGGDCDLDGGAVVVVQAGEHFVVGC